MAGCKKADRNRKSSHNMAYKAQKRDELNKKRRMAKDRKFREWKKANPPKVAKGSARAARRVHLQRGIS